MTAASPRLHQRDPAEAIVRNGRSRTPVATTVDEDSSRDVERGDAFRRHVLPELELLYAMAMRLTRDPDDAEDLVQDTLVRAVGALDRFDGRHPRAWLLTILRNTHINRVTKKRPSLLFDPDAVLASLETGGADDGVAETALGRIPDLAMVSAMAALSEDHRRVLTLVDIDGLSYRETSELLGIPEGTVMSRLHRARRRVRDHLEDARHLHPGRAGGDRK